MGVWHGMNKTPYLRFPDIIAFVSVPKDLSKVKTKVAFNLTRRQLFCFSIARGNHTHVYF